VTNPVFPGRSFFHGTKVRLKQGDLIKPGYNSNYGKRALAAYIYLTGTLKATGPIEDDPNLTDKKFPGNPTLSYRSKDSLRVIGEVIHWQGHSADELKNMKDNVERSRQLGIEAIED
jgi:hypothetical protein